MEMASASSTVKTTVKKSRQDLLASRSFLDYGNTSLGTANSTRLPLLLSARLQKKTSNSLEKLSFISEKEDSSDLDSYHLEYSTYLLRKAQSRVLARNREQKQENVKKCLVSVKLEFEGLLDRYVKLSKEIGYFKTFFQILKESNRRIEDGNKVLKVLREDKFENFMKSLSFSLDHVINQLPLVDIEKSSVEELFNNKVWGTGSEMEECLKKIYDAISKNKDEVSYIATELVEIKKLNKENALLRERFFLVFEKISNEFLESKYKLFTGIVKKAFNKRQECKDGAMANRLSCDMTGFLQSHTKTENEQFTFQLSKLDCSYLVTPNSASTPQHK